MTPELVLTGLALLFVVVATRLQTLGDLLGHLLHRILPESQGQESSGEHDRSA